MAKFSVSPAAREDLDQIHAFISQEDPEAALSTFAAVAQMPGIGRPRTFRLPELPGLRSFRVDGFPNYLIFYRPVTEGIEIVRVLHGARNLDALFPDD
ncbi:MAG: type II toxin-antitoxin system RelE/ParE family toxin [Verrucomicrobiota bacterium]|jgi:toxin ParE1/3/4